MVYTKFKLWILQLSDKFIKPNDSYIAEIKFILRETMQIKQISIFNNL